MPAALNEVVHYLRRAADRPDEAALTDGHLLTRFLEQRDEAAVAALIRRHGPMVWGVCRRLLAHHHDVEDAFQATFLVLIRKAASIRERELVGNWLYGVAYQTALKARTTTARRRSRERQMTAMPEAQAPERDAWHDLRPLLDQELSRLPDRYRVAIVLCDLEGKTRKQAAGQLRVPEGTLAGRLTRGRALLARRLARRGLTLSGAALAALLAEQAAAAAVPVSVLTSTIKAVTLMATGHAAATTAISAKAAALTEGVLKAMLLNKLRTPLAVLVVLTLGLFGAGVLGYGALAEGQNENRNPEAAARQIGREDPVVPAALAATEDQSEKQAAPERPLRVTVTRPRVAEVASVEVFEGRLEAGQMVQVRSQQPGVVKQIGFKPGADVKKGDLLFELDGAPEQAQLEQANAFLAQALARLEISRQERERFERLAAEGGVPQGIVEEQKSQQATARAAVDASRAQVEKARANLQAVRILAPIDGRVSRPLVDSGNLVSAGPQGTVLTTVMALDPMRVVFEMDERSFLRYRRLMREGQVAGPGSPLYLALVDEDGFPHEGTLDSFDNVVRPDTGTVTTRGLVPNPDKLLLPGAFVRVQIPFGKRRSVLEVPESAVVAEDGKHFLYVLSGRDAPERRAVTLGARDGEWRIIEKGLKPDDWVVAERKAGDNKRWYDKNDLNK